MSDAAARRNAAALLRTVLPARSVLAVDVSADNVVFALCQVNEGSAAWVRVSPAPRVSAPSLSTAADAAATHAHTHTHTEARSEGGTSRATATQDAALGSPSRKLVATQRFTEALTWYLHDRVRTEGGKLGIEVRAKVDAADRKLAVTAPGSKYMERLACDAKYLVHKPGEAMQFLCVVARLPLEVGMGSLGTLRRATHPLLSVRRPEEAAAAASIVAGMDVVPMEVVAYPWLAKLLRKLRNLAIGAPESLYPITSLADEMRSYTGTELADGDDADDHEEDTSPGSSASPPRPRKESKKQAANKLQTAVTQPGASTVAEVKQAVSVPGGTAVGAAIKAKAATAVEPTAATKLAPDLGPSSTLTSPASAANVAEYVFEQDADLTGPTALLRRGNFLGFKHTIERPVLAAASLVCIDPMIPARGTKRPRLDIPGPPAVAQVLNDGDSDSSALDLQFHRRDHSRSGAPTGHASPPEQQHRVIDVLTPLGDYDLLRPPQMFSEPLPLLDTSLPTNTKVLLHRSPAAPSVELDSATFSRPPSAGTTSTARSGIDLPVHVAALRSISSASAGTAATDGASSTRRGETPTVGTAEDLLVLVHKVRGQITAHATAALRPRIAWYERAIAAADEDIAAAEKLQDTVTRRVELLRAQVAALEQACRERNVPIPALS